MTNGEKIKEIFPDVEIVAIVPNEIVVIKKLDNISMYSNQSFSYKWWNSEYIESTTKNDLPHCQHTDEEIAKSFIEDVETVKEQLLCGEQMDFPNTFDEFVKDYGFRDKQAIYTNGSELIPVFRVKQWLEHISTTKNDLVPKNVVERIIKSPRTKEQMLSVLNSLPPQEPITNNATNGDMIKAMFPNVRINVLSEAVPIPYVSVIGENYEFSLIFPLNWWNKPYKVKSEDKE